MGTSTVSEKVYKDAFSIVSSARLPITFWVCICDSTREKNNRLGHTARTA